MTDAHMEADRRAMAKAKKGRGTTQAPRSRSSTPAENTQARFRATSKSVDGMLNELKQLESGNKNYNGQNAKPKSRPARPKQVTKAPPKPKAPRASFTDPDKKISYSKQNVRTATQNKKAGDKLASKLKGNKSAAMKSIAKNRVAKSGAKSLAKGALKSVARRSAPFAAVAAGKSLYDATQTPAAKKRVADRKKNTAKMTRKGMDIATGKAARKKAAKATTKPIRIKHPGQAARKKAAKPKK
jgi:hypothetical protein